MTWWLPHNFENQKPYLEKRMAMMKAVRSFFDTQDFYEIETPILQVSPVMDTHIHAFKTDLLGVDLKHDRTLYLHTSPEFAMKKLMVAGLISFTKSATSSETPKGQNATAPNSP